MSRRYGRFTGNGSEAFQRQMNAPVHKWKKAWVSPTGLQPESSYKICKWVRVDMNAEDGTPAPEEDEDMEEGEEGDQGEEGEGEGEDAAGEDGAADTKEDEAAAPTPAAGNVPDAAAEAVGTAATAEPVEPEANGMMVDAPQGVAGSGESKTPLPPTDPSTNAPSASTLPTSDQTIPPASEPSPTNPKPEATTEEPTIPITHPLPSNAIEISNTAPHTTELGSGDLSGVGGVEIKHAETQGMEVDEPNAAASGEGEKGEMLEMDDGLVMGDLEPVREEFVVQGEDKPREVDT